MNVNWVFFKHLIAKMENVVPNLNEMGQNNCDFMLLMTIQRSQVKLREEEICFHLRLQLPLAFSSSAPALLTSYSCCNSHFINISGRRVPYLAGAPRLGALSHRFLLGRR